MSCFRIETDPFPANWQSCLELVDVSRADEVFRCPLGRWHFRAWCDVDLNPPCLRQINPSGKISLFPKGKSPVRIMPSCPLRKGRWPSSPNVGMGLRWTQRRRARKGIAGRDQLRERSLEGADERCRSVRQNRVDLTP